MCAHHHVPVEQLDIKVKSGVDHILGTLDVELDASGLERLGIIVDADLDIGSRWASLQERLGRLGYQLPETADVGGTVVEQTSRPGVGVWVMPDNKLPGMLEDFVSFLGAANDPLWTVADNCLNEITDDNRKFSLEHRIKAHIHTWLAWQEKPGVPLGLAITFRYLDADAPHAQLLLGWIRRLFHL